tara:strand:- start:7624 stop:8415 length:792 start_codon:yes stop_codon:yes gene_type:complete
MRLIDIHAHLEHKRFEKDLDKVIGRFEGVGGEVVISSGVNPGTNRKALALSERYDVVKCSFGIYPVDALAKEIEQNEFLRDVEKFDVDKEIEWIVKNKEKCAAVGECGLDYNWITGKEKEQKKIFQKVIEMAEKIRKPIIIHSRKAELDAVEMLESCKIKKIVMHCFNGKKGLVKRARDNGWFFSVPPVIKRLHHFQNLVKLVDLKQLLTETDSPYLSPVAGERNEPKNVAVTIGEIAKIKSLSEKEVGEQIWENGQKVFGIE